MSQLIPVLLPPVAGFFLDLIIGDPRWIYHPVRLIGRLIVALKNPLRRIYPKTPSGERAAGLLLAVLVPLVTAVAVSGVTLAAGQIHVYLRMAVETLLCCMLLATRSLRDESMLVYHSLMEGDLEEARYRLSRIVGRDTGDLDEGDITRAAVETVAENASDGVIAPLFYLMLGGPVLGWVYKAVNTLDSMVGYQNARYRYFGTASACLDDVLNYIPARLAGLFMALAAGFCGMNSSDAMRIWRRDRRNHPSPNSAQTEAACAGALGIRLAGGASYFGVWKEKPTIGDDLRPPVPEDIPRANRLMLVTAFLIFPFFLIIKALGMILMG